MTSTIFRLRNCFWFLALSLFLSACVDPALKAAGAFAANIAGGSEFDVQQSSESTGDVYELTVHDASWDKRFQDEEVLSVCALAFYNHLDKPQQNCYVRLIFHVGDDRVVKQTYSSTELQRADRCIDRVSSFFKWKPSMGIDSLKPFIDPIFFPDSLIEKIGKSVQLQDSLGNSFVRAELIGFEADTVANLPVITVKVNAVRMQNRQRYDAFVGLKSEQLLLVVSAEND